MILNRFGGWLNYPEYFFFWCYHGQNAVFNTMSYQNPLMDKLITNARFAESKPLYDGMVKDMVEAGVRGCAAHPDRAAHDGRGHAEEHQRLHLLVPSAAGLPPAGQGLSPLPCLHRSPDGCWVRGGAAQPRSASCSSPSCSRARCRAIRPRSLPGPRHAGGGGGGARKAGPEQEPARAVPAVPARPGARRPRQCPVHRPAGA
jgi:hypothetical protein